MAGKGTLSTAGVGRRGPSCLEFEKGGLGNSSGGISESYVPTVTFSSLTVLGYPSPPCGYKTFSSTTSQLGASLWRSLFWTRHVNGTTHHVAFAPGFVH